MNIQELITELEKIEDKSLPLYFYDYMTYKGEIDFTFTHNTSKAGQAHRGGITEFMEFDIRGSG